MLDVLSANTILYCKHWGEVVRFYRDQLMLPVNFSTDWFVEFRLNELSRLSIADEKRASIKTSRGKGITISLEVSDLEAVRTQLIKTGLSPSPIARHPWNAIVSYVFDPDGNRIEIWQKIKEMHSHDID
jgi:predicted enzyme related to lactoylglutathione lyase